MESIEKRSARTSRFSLGLISELISIVHKEYNKVIDENEAQDIGTKIAKFVLAKECESHAQAI